MRHAAWSVSIAGLAVGALAIVGGTTIGGHLGPLAAAYGILVALGALYAMVGLAIRDRAWRRLARPRPSTRVETLIGRRVF